MSFPEPTPEEIIEALGKTGFLLEQTTAKIISAAGFSTITGKAFKDPDEDKSREIDCTGYRLITHQPDQNWFISCRIIAECKNVKHPYVIVGRSPSQQDLQRGPEEVWFTNSEITDQVGDNRYRNIPRWQAMGFEDLPNNPYRTGFIGDQLLRLQLQNKAWSADNNGVFDSTVFPLAKAIRATQANNYRPTGRLTFGQDQFHMELIYPVLVTSSPVFQVNTDDDTPTVEKVPWSSVTRDLQTSSIRGTFLIHVVSVQHLAEFLEHCTLFLRHVGEMVAANPTLLSRRETIDT